MGKNKYPKAVKYYTKAIKLDGANATYHLNRAIANASLELWKAAEADSAKAVELGEPSPKCHYQLARARLRRANIEGAEAALKTGLEAHPDAAALSQLAAEIARERTRLEARRAKEAEAQAKTDPTTDGPSSVYALLEQARAAYSGGRLEDVISLLTSARSAAKVAANASVPSAEVRKHEVSVLSLLGKTNMQLRKWPESAEAFEALVALEESIYSTDNKEEREALSNASNNLGIAYKNAGRMSDAVAAMNKAYHLATNGDDQIATYQASTILQNIGQCLRAQKKSGEARVFFERALEIGLRLFHGEHASHALNHLCVARCHRDENQLREAIQSYTKALEIWSSKDENELLAEMPEVPNKERLDQLRMQCNSELGQLVQMMEQARQQRSGESPATGEGYTS
jgi:tetratricopeptide (TPR) repeat protein